MKKAESDAQSATMPVSRGEMRPNVARGAAVLLLVVAMMGFGAIIRSAFAATFQDPSEIPPGGNIPVTIWNRQSTATRQANASIDIDGTVVAGGTMALGDTTLDLGVADAGQNLIYGFVPYGTMNAADYLMLLQTENAGVYATRFRVDRVGSLYMSGSLTAAGSLYPSGSVNGGNANYNLGSTTTGQNVLYGIARYDYMHPTGDHLLKLQTYLSGVYTDRFTVNREGDVTSSGCFGPTLAGLTPITYRAGTTPVLSYYGADNTCNAAYAGSHVCTAEEILRSISCSQAGDPVRSLGGEIAWINGGPPGFTSNANDCIGWTSNASSAYGRYWSFNDTTGGYGTMTSCNAPGLKFACCQ